MKVTEDARGDTHSEYYQRKPCASHEQCWEYVLDVYYNLAKGTQFILAWEDLAQYQVLGWLPTGFEISGWSGLISTTTLQPSHENTRGALDNWVNEIF